jgi:predicted MPP superfamily phosphohydrolase
MATSNESDKTRIVCVSDTHARYHFTLPAGDILIHGGDFSMTGEQKDIEKFLEWLKSLTQFRLKIIIAGNHDLTLEPAFYEKTWKQWHPRQKEDYQQIGRLMRDPSLATNYGIIYLEDQEYIDPQTGLKFYGRLNEFFIFVHFFNQILFLVHINLHFAIGHLIYQSMVLN